MKKATTDGITKCLSMLGFNADVFLGKFDDNKYVQELKNKAEWKGPLKKTGPQRCDDSHFSRHAGSRQFWFEWP